MTAFYALEILKNRTAALSLNHKIGSRDCAKQEVKEIVMCFKTHVIPTLEKALNELEELKRDVKRYFELATNDEITEEVLEEFSKIRDKLMEGGKENEKTTCKKILF